MSSSSHLRCRAAPWLAAGLLAACAHAPPQSGSASSSLESAAQPEPPVPAELPPAAALGAIQASGTGTALSDRRDTLNRLLRFEVGRGDLAAPAVKAEVLRTDWSSAALFESGTAQLRAQALMPLARLARWLRADGCVVIQVLGQQMPDQQMPGGAGLGARRAAAVAAFLIAEGALPGRVRAQAVSSSADIGLRIRPVIEGREALAWTPAP